MFSGFLLSLVGIREDILRQAPSDRARYLSMGAILLATACVAAVAATFAVRMALRAPLPLALLVGIGWGVLILTLDRMMVIGMNRQKGRWRTALMVAPRIVLAVLLGAVVSTPIVLQIFDREIQAQIKVEQSKNETDYQRDLATDPAYQTIPDLETKVAELSAIASRDPAVIDRNPAVRQAQDAYDAASATLDEAAKAETCERAGWNCENSTGVEGIGEAARAAMDARQRAQEVVDQKKVILDKAKADAKAAEDINAVAAQAELQRIQPELDRLRAARDAKTIDYRAKSENSDGLAARLDALDALSAASPSINRMRWVLWATFLAIELLPVLFKLLQMSGAPTLYERLSDLADQSDERAASARIAQEENRIALARELDADRDYLEARERRRSESL
ncbi:DUF4407 domain-containing protein [Nocardia caishijiensis]|uniref:Uncharacterized protein DUF4407 n=1 Tax=Nocardia caishijiensis TaxID=184756 RepID=A0ABQ6YHL5_9NOCA|nr:DUF4407 domain-containing protein [Nocardia caishijiensis]KAF0845288.1 uncharacterized protein DUF4407 [Nocardia caishijiensis]